MAIGFLGAEAKPAIPVLVNLLSVDGGGFSFTVAEALSMIGPPAVPPLIEALSSQNPSRRAGAALALGNLGSEAIRAVPGLIEMLDDESQDVREEGQGALGSIIEAEKSRDSLSAVLSAIDRNEVVGTAIAARLRSSGFDVSDDGKKAIVEYVASRIPDLINQLRGSDRDRRIRAAEEFRRFGVHANSETDPLRALLDDESI